MILETLKSWATRAIKKHRQLPANGTFWIAKGSKRKLADECAIHDSVIYVVRCQPNPFAVWFHPKWQGAVEEFERASQLTVGMASRTP